MTGRLPLRFRAGELPGYTSSDGTLWALIRLHQYVLASGDTTLFEEKRTMVEHFFSCSIDKTHMGLLPSGGVAVAEHEWETWMDTEYSARAGYPIEIQLLWLAGLERFCPLLEPSNPALSMRMAATVSDIRSALDRFKHDEYFVDLLDRSFQRVDLLTPNGYFWTVLSIDFDWEWEERSLALGRRELGGVSGVRTLARSQWETVLGPQIAALARRDRPLPSIGKVNYHRGVEWNWLAQLFVAGEIKHGQPDMAYDHHLARQIYDCTNIAGLGGVSEVFDHRGPAGPDFQAWSMTGLVEALHRFLGVKVDVPSSRMVIVPRKPRRWPYIRSRKWYGDVPVDIEYRATRGGMSLEVRFEREPQSWPTLHIELPLRRQNNPHSVKIDCADGVRKNVDFEILERPRRICLETAAQPYQVIRVQDGAS